MPNQKSGTDMPISANADAARSGARRGCAAAATPRDTPIATAIVIAIKARGNVTCSRSAISGATGTP